MFDRDKTPFFSVIIPTYNRAATISSAIRSVINQSFNNWELIVMDDGSTDSTKDVVDSFLDNRIRYFWHENQERSASRNKGVYFSKGDWICFLDSDDEYQENHLEVLYKAISQNKECFIFRTGSTCIDNKGNVVKTKMKECNQLLCTYPFEFIHFFAFNKKVFDKHKFDFRFYQMEDMHFLIRCGEEFTFYQIHEWTYIYNINPVVTGRIGRDFEKYISNKNQCIDDMLTFKFNPLKKFLIWTKLTNGMFLLHGYIKYKPIMIFNGLFINLKNLFKFPNTYSKIVLRIVMVKFNEFFGSDYKDNRF